MIDKLCIIKVVSIVALIFLTTRLFINSNLQQEYLYEGNESDICSELNKESKRKNEGQSEVSQVRLT